MVFAVDYLIILILHLLMILVWEMVLAAYLNHLGGGMTPWTMRFPN